MTKEEGRSPAMRFSREINQLLLAELKEKFCRIGSLRLTVAHHIEERGLMYRSIVGVLFPDDEESKLAVDEYTEVGTLILEADGALRSGNYQDEGNFAEFLKGVFGSDRCRFLKEKKQADLLVCDPRGFRLLAWWVNLGLEEFKRLPKEQRQAAVIGRLEGVDRYKKLYEALVAEGLPQDTK